MEQSELTPQVQVEEVTPTAPIKKRSGLPKPEEIEALIQANKLPHAKLDLAERKGSPKYLEKMDADWQGDQMKLINGDLLLSFRRRIKNRELDIKDEIQLFKAISPFMGYSSSSQKNSEDIGMDAFAERYVEIEAKVKSTSRIAVSKV